MLEEPLEVNVVDEEPTVEAKNVRRRKSKPAADNAYENLGDLEAGNEAEDEEAYEDDEDEEGISTKDQLREKLEEVKE
jgi:hypothetical protein